MLLLLCLALVLGRAVSGQRWPSFALPAEATTLQLGSDVVRNGVPMYLQGFVSTLPPGALVERFRAQMKGSIVENRLGRLRILGQMQGPFYITVQIEPLDAGSQGVVGITLVKGEPPANSASAQKARRWTARMPAGSILVSDMTSNDGRKSGWHVVIQNDAGIDANVERLHPLLAEEGVATVHGRRETESPLASLPAGVTSSRTLFLGGSGKEAVVSINRDEAGHTTVVVNVTSQTQAAR